MIFSIIIKDMIIRILVLFNLQNLPVSPTVNIFAVK